MSAVEIIGILIFILTTILTIRRKKKNKKQCQKKNYIQDNTKLNLFLAKTFLNENQNITEQNHNN